MDESATSIFRVTLLVLDISSLLTVSLTVKLLATFPFNRQRSSCQSFQHPLIPNEVTLKIEAALFSATSEKKSIILHGFEIRETTIWRINFVADAQYFAVRCTFSCREESRGALDLSDVYGWSKVDFWHNRAVLLATVLPRLALWPKKPSISVVSGPSGHSAKLPLISTLIPWIIHAELHF